MSTRDYVRQLRDQGWTQKRVAQVLNRSPRAIRQIEKGSKPYANLEPAARAAVGGDLARASELALAARRTTKRGKLATVRGSMRTPAGLHVSTDRPEGHGKILAAIDDMHPDRHRVTLTVTLTEGELPASGRPITEADPVTVQLGAHGGLRKSALVGAVYRLNGGGVEGLRASILDLIENAEAGGLTIERSEPILSPGGITALQCHVRPHRPGGGR